MKGENDQSSKVLGWKLSPVVFYRWLTIRNTTGLSFQPIFCLFQSHFSSFKNEKAMKGRLENDQNRANHQKV